MSEKVIIRQKRNYETSYMALDQNAKVNEKPRSISNINELTPYGMVLAGLGTCTGFVVNTYAEHHGLRVDVVELPGSGYNQILHDGNRRSDYADACRCPQRYAVSSLRVKDREPPLHQAH